MRTSLMRPLIGTWRQNLYPECEIALTRASNRFFTESLEHAHRSPDSVLAITR
jgi:hypothetical protein